MILCRAKSKIFFTCFLFLLLVFFLDATPVKADAVLTTLTISAGAVVVPAYSNNGILYCYNDCNAPSVDSVAMSGYSCQNGKTQLFYLNNPTVGSHTINKSQGQAMCFFVGGLNSTTPVSNEGNDNPNVDNYHIVNTNRNNTGVNNLVIGIFGGSDSGSGESGFGWTSASTTILSYTDIGQMHLVAGWQMSLSPYNNWYLTLNRTMYPLYGNKADYFVELAPYVAPIPPKPMIAVFGWPNLWSNPAVFQYNADKKYPIVWDACPDYANLEFATVRPIYSDGSYSPGTEVIYRKSDFIGPQKCQDTFIFTDAFSTIQSGTVHFDLTTYDINNNLISSTTSNTITFTTETPSQFIDYQGNNPLQIDMGSDSLATTTTLYFTYNFKDRNSASTTVYLWDYTLATTTAYTTTGPFSSTSTSFESITIPTPASSTSKIYKFIAVSPGYTNLQSKIFSVVWSWTLPTVAECKPPVFDFEHLCDGLNPDGIRCSIKYAFTVSVFYLFTPNCDSINSFRENYASFKSSFPFNAYFDLTRSINTAIDSAQTSTSTPGAFTIPFIRKTATTSQFYMLPMLSSTTMSNTIGSTNYGTFYLTIGWIWWLLIAVIVYFTVRKV